jgi:hypothetical protein
MSLYLLHIEPGYKHARHYCGFTPDLRVNRRAMEHIDGVRHKASPLILAALNAGCTVVIARRWEGPQYGRAQERRMKDGGTLPKYCPLCRARRRQANANP